MMTFLCWQAQRFLRLRYRIRIAGLEAVAARGRRGILFLPNHPALIDPVMVVTALRSRFRPLVLADRDQVNIPVLRRLLARIGVKPILDPALYGEAGRESIEAATRDCIEALRRGENLLFWPAGRIYQGRFENLGGNSLVETLLRAAPELRVVLIRTRGLWGSRFGRAPAGAPRLGRVLLKGLGILLANGLFFAPRREVSIELEEPADLPRREGRAALNRYLEAFYNRDAPPNTRVPDFFWERGGARTAPEPEAGRGGGTPAGPGPAADEVSAATREIVTAHLREVSGVRDIRDTAHLARDLGLDSLVRAELGPWLEQEFGVTVEEVESLQTVSDVLLAAQGIVQAAGPITLKPVPKKWFTFQPACNTPVPDGHDGAWPSHDQDQRLRSRWRDAFHRVRLRPVQDGHDRAWPSHDQDQRLCSRWRDAFHRVRLRPVQDGHDRAWPSHDQDQRLCSRGRDAFHRVRLRSVAIHPLVPAGATLAAVFLAQARRGPGRPALADQASGVLTYRDMLTAILALKPALAEMEGRYLGIMLPASSGAAVLYLAALFAGKIPVMVNWTAGAGTIAKSLDRLGVRRIVTAQALVARLAGQGLDLALLQERLAPVEEIGRRIGRRARLAAWFGARLRPGALAKPPVPDTAVVLFTSGSENFPKAVPLTHANILANLRDMAGLFRLRPGDCALGMLPPFHSFGLTCSILFPLCAGVRVVFHPNPTEGARLARTIEAYGVTLLMGTPTFLNGIIRAAGDRQLRTLRKVVAGAEKCPAKVYEAVSGRWPHLAILEGYGITECSPVVSANDENDIRPGTIGKALPSVEYALRAPEGAGRAPPGQPGMLLVRGPSVFGGYLEYDGPSPFEEFEGKTWYRTGDLVTEGPGGVLTFTGRLKRFVKLGGEMISLPAIEEALARAFAPGAEPDEGPVLAVEGAPAEANPDLVLFTTREIGREEANRALREAGLSPLHNLRHVRRVEAIPVLGTGKTDYRALRALLAAP